MIIIIMALHDISYTILISIFYMAIYTIINYITKYCIYVLMSMIRMIIIIIYYNFKNMRKCVIFIECPYFVIIIKIRNPCSRKSLFPATIGGVYTIFPSVRISCFPRFCCFLHKFYVYLLQ